MHTAQHSILDGSYDELNPFFPLWSRDSVMSFARCYSCVCDLFFFDLSDSELDARKKGI